MTENLRQVFIAHILVLVVTLGLLGSGLAFLIGVWPFSRDIDLNTANQASLAALPDVGDARAEAIVEYRRQHGSFKDVEEVKQIPGVGDEVFASFKDLVTAGEKEQLSADTER
jgi:competence protein ComEA